MSRERCPIWDELDSCFGPCRTKTEGTLRGKVVRELKEAGATAEEVRITYDWCKRHFDPFTEMALLKYLSRAQHEAMPQTDNVTAIRKLAGLG
jgi:hypothetical protein